MPHIYTHPNRYICAATCIATGLCVPWLQARNASDQRSVKGEFLTSFAVPLSFNDLMLLRMNPVRLFGTSSKL